ncbi:hypothetical protein Hanom_Chr02g00115651 [Helianthus anomalus]
MTSDLLYKDYQSDHKFALTTYAANGVVQLRFVNGIYKGPFLIKKQEVFKEFTRPNYKEKPPCVKLPPL